jgi:peptidoglycan/LPS O-acetylase OafA/YrhL
MAPATSGAAAMIANIQFLRAVAAIMVVVHHIRPFVNGIHPGAFMTDIGAAGVDIFFVISGFVMVYANRDLTRSSQQFWRERAVRILPLYWIVTFVIVALYAIGFRPVGLHGWSWGDLVTSLLLWPNVRVDGVNEPILTLGWTLIYEAFFYAIFGLMLSLKSLTRAVSATSVVFGLLVLAGLVMKPTNFAGQYYTSPLILEFLAGCGLGLAYLGSDLFTRPAWRQVLWPLVGTAIALVVLGDGMARAAIFSNGWMRVALVGVPAAGIVAATIALEASGRRVTDRLLLLLGSASYAIYLAHMLVLQGTWKALAKLLPQGVPAVSALMALTAVAMAIAAGVVMHRWLELPLTRWLRSGEWKATGGVLERLVRRLSLQRRVRD